MSGRERFIGYTVGDLDSGFEDVCLDCIDEWDDSIPRHSLTDSETYGDVVPYPECAGCGEVMDP